MYVYIGIGSTCMYKGQFKRRALIKPSYLSQLKGLRSSKISIRVQLLARHFHFVFFFYLAFHALLVGRLSPYQWNQAWHSSEVIGTYREWSFEWKIAAVLVPTRYFKRMCTSWTSHIVTCQKYSWNSLTLGYKCAVLLYEGHSVFLFLSCQSNNVNTDLRRMHTISSKKNS